MVHYCLFVNYDLLQYIGTLWYTAVYLVIMVHCCISGHYDTYILLYIWPLWNTAVYLAIMIYCRIFGHYDLLQYIGPLWYTAVYLVIMIYCCISGHYDTLLYIWPLLVYCSECEIVKKFIGHSVWWTKMIHQTESTFTRPKENRNFFNISLLMAGLYSFLYLYNALFFVIDFNSVCFLISYTHVIWNQQGLRRRMVWEQKCS